MEEIDRNVLTGGKINTLKKSLMQFGMPSLLEQLDINLELVRRGKESKEKLLLFLKSEDKKLMKLSRTHHPDKAIKEKKLDEEVTNAQNMQIALNATRTVLKSLTEVFLKDIDVHYKYEFFAKLDINTLINEKQIDLEINNVLCKISRLSEVKRVSIIGEIRKFLQESQKCLINFLEGINHDFVWHRSHALRHLHKCIEGYKIFATECKLIVDSCSVENDENTRVSIQKMMEESLRESEFLQNLEIVAKRFLGGGTFEIFPTYRFGQYYFMDLAKYEPVEPKELEYFVLPFILYVDVLLMCSVMVEKKSRLIKFFMKIEETLEYFLGYDTEESINFTKQPISFINKEPALLKAYYLVCYFINKNLYKKQVQSILKNKFHCMTETNIREAFKETVKEIEKILAKRFDINLYKEGKSNREHFNERLFQLNNSMAEFKEVENNLLEKMKLYEKEANDIRKKYLELFGKNKETDQECRENFSKYGDLRENNETESVHNIEEHEETDQKNTNENDRFPECIFGNENTDQTTQMADDQRHDYFKKHSDSLKEQTKETPGFSRDQLNKELLIGQFSEHVSNEPAETYKTQLNIKVNNKLQEHSSGSETGNQTTQMANDKRHDSSKEHDESSKMHEETSCFNRYQQHKESLSDQLFEYLSNEPDEADKDIKANNSFSFWEFITGNTFPESISGNKFAQMANDQYHDDPKEHDECPNVHVEETPCSHKDQLQKESLSCQLPQRVSNEPGETELYHKSIKGNHISPESISGNKIANQTAQMANNKCHNFHKEHNECPHVHVEKTPCSNRDPNESLSGQLPERDSKEPGETDKDQQTIESNKTSPESISGIRTANKTAQVANDQCYDFSKEHYEVLKMHAEESPCSNRDQQDKESLSGQLQENNFKESGETDKDKQNIKANNTSPENISGNKNAIQTAQMANDQCYDFHKEHDECSRLHAEESICFDRNQRHKEALSDQLLELVSKEPVVTEKDQQNINANSTTPESFSGNKTANQTAQMADDQRP